MNTLESQSSTFDLLLLNQSGEMLLAVDPRTQLVVAANRRVSELLGYPPSELIGKPITEIESSLTDVFYWDGIRQGEPGEVTHVEGLYRRSDGGMIPVTKDVRRVSASGGDWLVLRVRDERERKRDEESLAQLASQLKATIEATGDGILVTDTEGHVVNMNRRFGEMWGIPEQVPQDGEDTITAGIVARVTDPEAYRRGMKAAALDHNGEYLDVLELTDGRFFERRAHPQMLGNQVIGRVYGFHDFTERKRTESIVEQYRSVIQASLDGFWITDASGRILDVNESICRMLGYSRDELLRLSVRDIEADESPEDIATRIREMMATGSVQFETRHKRKDGTRINVEIVVLYLADLGERFFAFVRDITARKQAEVGLRLAASVFSNSYDGVVITDGNNVVIDINPAVTRITGYAREEIIGQSPGIFASGRQGAEFYAGMWESLRKHDFWRGEIWNRRKSGEVYAEMLSISVVRDSAGNLQHYIGVFSDISQLKTHEAELHRIAHYDVLTGVPNRRLLADRLDQAIARARRSGRPMAVCYLDLDGFKPINDQYGHAAGDHLLVEITERLKSVLRAEDTLARLGGDEFVLLFTDLAQFEEVHLVLDRVLKAVSSPVMIGDVSVGISASIGVTLYPADDADADTLLRHADQAMYRAKESGKNRAHLFDPERDRQVQAHRYQLQRLREALENGEFVLHYQPKVDLISGEVIGAEALIRWQHPEQGLLPPSAFLYHLDGSDLEIAVGEWVIGSVLKQIAAWNAIGLNLTVSANVSADHLLQIGFADSLRRTLERHPDVAPGNLELEILETAALANMDQAVHALTRCRQLGVHFALDDFGTGYSSLTYFRNLPVDILKIDQSFVREMLDDPGDLGIVESVVRLAQAFNRPVIAEGVETLEHGAMLVHLGCRLAQGYGIARPMPAEQFPGWVSQWRSQAAWLTMDSRLTSREDVTLLVAAQSHRNWIDKIAGHLDHPQDEAPNTLDSVHCRFGRWYQGSGAARYGEFREFQAIAPLHETVHIIATGLVALARDGQLEAARDRLPDLYAGRDQLLAQVEALIQKLDASNKAGTPILPD